MILESVFEAVSVGALERSQIYAGSLGFKQLTTDSLVEFAFCSDKGGNWEQRQGPDSGSGLTANAQADYPTELNNVNFYFDNV